MLPCALGATGPRLDGVGYTTVMTVLVGPPFMLYSVSVVGVGYIWEIEVPVTKLLGPNRGMMVSEGVR